MLCFSPSNSQLLLYVVEPGKCEKDFVQFFFAKFEFVKAQLDGVLLLFFIIGLRASFRSNPLFGLSFLVEVLVAATVSSLLMVQGNLSSPSSVLGRNKWSR